MVHVSAPYNSVGPNIALQDSLSRIQWYLCWFQNVFHFWECGFGNSNSVLDLIYTSSIITHCLTQIIEASCSFYCCSVNFDADFRFVLISADNHCFCLLGIHFHVVQFVHFIPFSIMFYKFSSLSAQQNTIICIPQVANKIWVPPIVTPLISSMCLKMVSVYKFKRHGDSTHCFTPLLIHISSERLFSSRLDALCVYYRFTINLRSFPFIPISLRQVIIFSWLTRSNAFS